MTFVIRTLKIRWYFIAQGNAQHFAYILCSSYVLIIQHLITIKYVYEAQNMQ